MKKLGKILFCFVPFLVSLGLQFVVMIPAMEIYVLKALHSGILGGLTSFFEQLMQTATNTSFVLNITVLYAIINLVLFSIWYRALLKRQHRHGRCEDFSFLRSIIPCIILAFGLYYLTNYLVAFLSQIQPQWLNRYNDIMDSMGFGGGPEIKIGVSILMFVYALIIAPVSEELTFRGVTMLLAKRQMPFFLANIFQAALFGLMHMNILQGLYAFFVGLFLGYVCHNRGTIKASILLHILFNAIGTFLAAYLPVYGGDAVYLHMLILAAAIIVTVLGFLWYCRHTVE